MYPMHLWASMVVPTVRTWEPLAVLDVISDTARRHDEDTVRRDVVGTVRQRGSIWIDYLTLWQGIAANSIVQQFVPAHMQGVTECDKTFLMVNLLQVDHDFYGGNSWLNVEGDTVRLILMEQHEGTIEEYQADVSERNRRIRELIDRAESGIFTRNDLREVVMGLPRGPQFEHRLAPDALHAMLNSQGWRDATRNMVV
jgi:hypothetical protein